MDMQTLRQQIYQAALPLLRGRTVTDLTVGLSLLAVELDGRDVAVSYVLRENLRGGCSVFSYAQQTVGMSAQDAAAWFVTGGDDLQRAIGGAVINAASQFLALNDSGSREKPFDLDLGPGIRVGMVGNIHPVAMQLKKLGCSLVIFDKGTCAHGNPAADIHPMEQQQELLPTCDIVFLSGTTMINGTAAPLFDLCAGAKDLVLMGTSTPMIPDGYRDTPVSILAGSWWKKEDKQTLFRLISQAAGIQALGSSMLKKTVRI